MERGGEDVAWQRGGRHEEWRWRKAGWVVGFSIWMAVVYSVCYVALVERELVGPRRTLGVAASYSFGGEVHPVVFAPAHYIDRCYLRSECWSVEGLLRKKLDSSRSHRV